jgi:hypothetical protein
MIQKRKLQRFIDGDLVRLYLKPAALPSSDWVHRKIQNAEWNWATWEWEYALLVPRRRVDYCELKARGVSFGANLLYPERVLEKVEHPHYFLAAAEFVDITEYMSL